MDRLEDLSQQLVEQLDQQPSSGDCIGPVLLEQFVSGTLDEETRRGVDAHLDTCLRCLDRFVAFRDSLHGLAAPKPTSPQLAAKLRELMGVRSRSLWAQVGDAIHAALTTRIPVAVAATVAVSAVLVTWFLSSSIDRGDMVSPPPVSRPTSVRPLALRTGKERIPEALSIPGRTPVMTPLTHRTGEVVPRTITGVVVEVSDATFQAMEAHFFTIKDETDAEYIIFAWGPSTLQEGDTVEVNGTFQEITKGGKPFTYRGLAATLRKIGSQ